MGNPELGCTFWIGTSVRLQWATLWNRILNGNHRGEHCHWNPGLGCTVWIGTSVRLQWATLCNRILIGNHRGEHCHWNPGLGCTVWIGTSIRLQWATLWNRILVGNHRGEHCHGQSRIGLHILDWNIRKVAVGNPVESHSEWEPPRGTLSLAFPIWAVSGSL
jgi:hypothetical protein